MGDMHLLSQYIVIEWNVMLLVSWKIYKVSNYT